MDSLSHENRTSDGFETRSGKGIHYDLRAWTALGGLGTTGASIKLSGEHSRTRAAPQAMRSHIQLVYLLLSFISLSSLTSAACESYFVIPVLLIICFTNLPGPQNLAPTSFCKCVCFTNSTIIALDPPASSPTSPAFRSALFASRADGANSDAGLDDDGRDRKEYRAGNCNDCNRQFCLDYNLPICKGARVEDVFTTCFRTSNILKRDWVSGDGTNKPL